MTDSTTAPGGQSTRAFDPPAWLHEFEEVGGAYVLTDASLNLMMQVHGQPLENLTKARNMIAALTVDQTSELRAHLHAIAHGTCTPADFKALVGALAAVEAIPIDETTDETFDLAGDLCCRIMQTPAPDVAALLWKLDYLLASDGQGSTAPWAAEFVAQTVTDYRRILGEARHGN